MFLDVIDETNQVETTEMTLVEEILLFAASYLKLPSAIECAVTFVDNTRIQEINRDYRQKDMPTDVISFALDDESENEPNDDGTIFDESFTHHLGDIIISIDKAKEQANEYGHSFERELGFLALHGFLHLNGYDHMTPEDEHEMFTLQKKILSDYGLERAKNCETNE